MAPSVGHSENRESGSVNLRDYIEAKIDAMELARRISVESLDKRLEGMNEFRSALKDQTSQMITRSECRAIHGPVDYDIRTLREFKAELAGKASQLTATVGIIFGIAGVLIALSSLIVSIIKG